MPSCLASLLRATTQPSLLDSTTTGLPSSSGLNNRSQLTKKLLQSISANTVFISVSNHVAGGRTRRAPFCIVRLYYLRRQNDILLSMSTDTDAQYQAKQARIVRQLQAINQQGGAIALSKRT